MTLPNDGSASGINILPAIGGNLLFQTGNSQGSYLWTTDGTVAGTIRLTGAQVGHPTVVGDTLYFTQFDFSPQQLYSIWKTDGTAAGTKQVVADVSSSLRLANLSGQLLVGTATSLETLDPSTNTLTTLAGCHLPLLNFAQMGNEMYFSANTLFPAANGKSAYLDVELWKTDGTADGTSLVSQIAPALTTTTSQPQNFIAAGSHIFFNVNDGQHGWQLWESDGTGGGTAPLTNVNGGQLGFLDQPDELWASAINGKAIFSGNGPQQGMEPWVTDGTAAGTAPLANLNTTPNGTSFYSFQALGSQVFFTADDGVNGLGLYSSNDGGIPQLLPEAPGYTYRTIGQSRFAILDPSVATAAVGSVGPAFFFAHGGDLWMSDGTGPGTVMIKSLAPSVNGGKILSMTAAGAHLFMRVINPSANDYELWSSDGTAAGTVFLRTLSVSSQVGSIGSAAIIINQEAIGASLSVSDGTPAGTTQVYTWPTIGNWIASFASAQAGNKYFFQFSDGTHGNELWVTDGTADGTSMVKDITLGALDTSFLTLNPIGSTLYFVCSNEKQLWRTDGTAAGTIMLAQIIDSQHFLGAPTVVGNTLYFTGYDSAHGQELWSSDGTVAGTHLAVDLNPGAGDSGAFGAQAFKGALFFAGNDGDGPQTLYMMSNGLTGTPLKVAGAPGSAGPPILSTGSVFYFVASDLQHGRQLWIYKPSPVNPVAHAGGPYSVAEGASVILDGSQSSEAGGSIVSYQWDLNYNGSTFNGTASGKTVSFSAAGLDGPSSRTIALKVIDGTGQSAISTATLNITDAPPAAKFTGGSVTLGSTGKVTFSSPSDPSPADVAAGYKYSYDFNNDGTFEITDSTSATATVPATYLATPGNHTIHGRIKDRDGGYTDYTATISVTALIKASISGTVFADNNGNGKLDSTEKGVSGRKIYIDKNKNGVLDAGEPTFTTGANGAFTFTGLAAGTYRVRDVLPSGWRRTSPTAGYYDITATAGQSITGKNFAETTYGLISGIVFKDANGNSVKDSTEVGLGGWVVYLDANNNGKLDPGELSFTTGSDGKFSFTVPAGTYHLREVLKSGFKRTAPSTGVYTIALVSGQTASARNFGDK
jgi:ELWxxDGT repeat protein